MDTTNTLKNLRENMELSNKLLSQLEGQMEGMEAIMEGLTDNLTGEDKNKIDLLKAMTRRVLAKAKKGEDFNEALSTLKKTFKQ